MASKQRRIILHPKLQKVMAKESVRGLGVALFFTPTPQE